MPETKPQLDDAQAHAMAIEIKRRSAMTDEMAVDLIELAASSTPSTPARAPSREQRVHDPTVQARV